MPILSETELVVSRSMAKHTYTPQRVYSEEITFEIEGGVLRKVQFTGGCAWNLQAIYRLVEGM